MPFERHQLDRRLSGGAANTDPDLSLGGAKSAHLIVGQTAVYQASAMSGVTMVEGRGNDDFQASPTGGAVMAFFFTTTEMRWEPPNEVPGPQIDVSVDGRYTLPGPNDQALLVIDVVSANLPTGDQSRGINVQTAPNELFDDVGAVEAFLGVTNYRCYYIENVDGVETFFGMKAYIGAQPTPTAVTLDIGLDPAGLNGVATTIVDENTAPGGVVFSQPGAYSSGLLVGDMTPGDFQAIWVRRTVPPGSTTPAPRDVSEIKHGSFF